MTERKAMRRKIRVAIVAAVFLVLAGALFGPAEEKALSAQEILALSAKTVVGVTVAKERGDATSFFFGPGLFIDWNGTKGAHLLVGGDLFSDGTVGTRYTVFIGDRRVKASLVSFLSSAEVSVIGLAEPWGEAEPLSARAGSAVSPGDSLYVVYCLPPVFRHKTAVRRTICTGRKKTAGGQEVYVTSLPLEEGMAGALVFDSRGRAVGVLKEDAAGELKIGVVLPVSALGKFIGTMKNKKPAVRVELKPSDNPAWFGAVVSPNSPRVFSCYKGRKPKLDGKAVTWGVFVSGILSGSPAEENGFKPMDLIIEVNGVRVANEYTDLEAFFASLTAGSEVKVSFLRYNEQGKEWMLKERKFALQRRPPTSAEQTVYDDDFFKIQACPFTWDLRLKTFILDAFDGVYLKKVEPDGAFGLFGIESGTVVLRVNGKDTPDMASFKNALASLRGKNGTVFEVLVCTPDGYTVPVYRRIKIP